jgi:hypothetical protein
MLGKERQTALRGRDNSMHVVLIIAACLLLVGLLGANDTDHDWWD